MEFKGTKGKWELSTAASGGISIDSIDPKDGLNFEVCEVWGINNDMVHSEESKANALLISKAPEILEMLIDIVNANNKGNLEHLNFYQIEQLIKEATEL